MGCREHKSMVNKYNRLRRLIPTMEDKKKQKLMMIELKRLESILNK